MERKRLVRVEIGAGGRCGDARRVAWSALAWRGEFIVLESRGGNRIATSDGKNLPVE